MIVKEPSSPEELEAYFNIRWQILRQPWKKPRGSERDEIDEMKDKCVHVIAFDEPENIYGVTRLHNNNEEEGQIRYMGVIPGIRNKGVGSALIHFVEKKAREKKLKSIVLHARENAVDFYAKNNYLLEGKSYMMWDRIQHFQMRKKL